jgi:hypothetical protein
LNRIVHTAATNAALAIGATMTSATTQYGNRPGDYFHRSKATAQYPARSRTDARSQHIHHGIVIERINMVAAHNWTACHGFPCFPIS